MALVKTRPHYNVVFAVLLLGIAAYAMLQSMVVPVFSLLIPALHTTQATATWLMTGYLLSASVATPILGRIGDKVGKERMLLVTLIGLTVGSLIAALTESVSVMIVARVIQGLGGGVIPLAFGIIRDEFPGHKLNGAVGIASSLIAVGSGLGLVLAGPIVDHLNYHWLFWIPMIMTAVAAIAAVLFVPESPVRSPGRINWGAAVLLSAWLVALLLAVSKGPSWGWTSVTTLGLFALTVVCAVAWVVVEMRSETPLIDMTTMRIPAVWTTNIVAVLTGAAMYAMMTFLPQLLQTPKSVAGYGLSASITASGLYLLPLSVAMFVIGLAIGPLAARLGSKAIVLIGAIITAPAFFLLAIGHDQSWEIYLAAGLLGIGIGMAFSSMPAIIVAAVPPAQTGAATGMNANVRTVGGAIGSAVSSVILTSGAHAAHGLPADSGYANVFWFLGAVSAAAAVVSVFIPSGRPRELGSVELAHSAEAEAETVVAQQVVDVAPLSNGVPVSGSAVVLSISEQDLDAGVGSAVVGYVRRAGGQPVGGAALTLIDPRGQQVSRVTGDADGGYRIAAPGPGNYVLITSAHGHRPVAVSVAVGARPHRLTVTLPGSGELTGVVRDPGGVPVSGATVTLTNAHGEVVGAVVTGADGAYSCGVTPGAHTVVVVAERMRPAASTVVVPESGALRHDVELDAAAVLVGAVQAGDRVVPDAQVTVLDESGELVATARTDESGRYLVPDLPAGRYAVVTRGYPSVASSVRVEGERIHHDLELGYDDVPLPVR
ncbi:MFS transporter [Nocardia macrotermitis]|uniref:Putative multidrug resistance protein MdtD n=1 Tax=Nocardia macrotermitis TaxID=2585198 RepID=A0A7K0D1M9_9NOCA|nr:MFS transporter [Nocardia macrotermitis]MQY19598.1 putative multidrug resistance protein MdtD [Nocardia macrotermitis]